MPIIQYECESGLHWAKAYHRDARTAPESIACAACGCRMERQLSGGSSSSKMVVDNGVQARATEIIPGVAEANQEMANKKRES